MRLLIISLLLFIPQSFASAKTLKAIIISSYHKELEQKRQMVSSIIENHQGVIKKVLYLNSKRVPREKLSNKVSSFLNIIDQENIKLVYICDDNALKLFGNHLAKRDLTVIFTGINTNPRIYFSKNSIPQNFYGVLEKPFYNRAALKLSSLFKGSNKSVIIFDNSETSKIIISDFFKNKSTVMHNGITFSFQVVETVDDLKNSITKANTSNSYIIAGPIHTIENDKNKTEDFETILDIIALSSKRPFFGFWKDYVGHGHAMASYGVSLKNQGKTAAELAVKVLEKKSNQRLITPQRGEFFLDIKQFRERKYQLPNY